MLKVSWENATMRLSFAALVKWFEVKISREKSDH